MLYIYIYYSPLRKTNIQVDTITIPAVKIEKLNPNIMKLYISLVKTEKKREEKMLEFR